MQVKEGSNVTVRQLGQAEIRNAVVTVLHGENHVTCEIEGPNGPEIESVSFSKGHTVDASWDWPKA